jgi:uncharacterized heparinase superfamily protein
MKVLRTQNPAFRLSPRSGWQALGRLAFRTPLYGLTLIGRTPKAPRGTPPDPWSGDATTGAAIVHGGPDTVAGTALHRFEWLRDLRAQGDEAAGARARDLISQWLVANRRWSVPAWRPDILGERVANWFSNYAFVCTGGDDGFRAAFLDSAARQVRHLGRVATSGPADVSRFLAIKGLVYGAVCLPGFETGLPATLSLLATQADRQILPDGGHFQRNPGIQLDLLRHLVDMRETLKVARVEVPEEMQRAIDRMAPMLRFFRHADGRLALFNDGSEGDERHIDMVLAQAGARGKPPSNAPHCGFHRLAAGRTLLLVDTGAPPSLARDSATHAGTLGFEMSVGKERLIVNCGTNADGDPRWHLRLRATAAHSTLIVDDTNSTELLAGGGIGRRPAEVVCSRREADGNIWIEASHDGYKPGFGLIHGRDLYLSADGGDVRGRDFVSGTGGTTATVRFHLHPGVKASVVQGGQAALLRLPKGGGWRFEAAGGGIAIEESVYFGRGEMKRNEQIAVTTPLGAGETTIKWRLNRISP